MDIFSILGVRTNADKYEVKNAYLKKISYYHPTKITGNKDMFIKINDLYKNYLLGNDFVNCLSICYQGDASYTCRCGGLYDIEKNQIGRVDCLYCSCFIIIEKPIGMLE